MSSDLNIGIDYELVLKDLREKRDKIDAAIAGIEAMLGVRGLPANAPAQTATISTFDPLGPGAFLGMTIADATVLLLKARRANLKTEEIVTALKAGGIAMTSASPLNTVGSVLNREWSNGGDIVRVDRGVWGLAEWHPRLRKRKNGQQQLDADAMVEELANAPSGPATNVDPLS